MTAFLLAAWVALLGADRIDFGGGNLPVAVTPFLVLTPLLVLAQAAKRLRTGDPLNVPAGGRTYALVLLAFLALIGASVFGSLDPETSMARALLVVMQALGTLAVALQVYGNSDAEATVRHGAVAGIILFAVFDALCAASFLGMLPSELPIGFAVLKLQSFGYAGIVPRLSGSVLDPNRAGLLLIFYAILARRLRGPAVGMLLLTLSRSATLAGLGVVAVHVWEGGILTRHVSRRAMLAGVVVLATALAAIGRSSESLDATQRALAPFSERFSLSEEGSASVHSSLLGRAVEEGTRSPKRAMLGLGWGASYVVLQDIFPGSRYGNFHSLYATAFAEAGFPAAVLITLLLVVPIVRRGPWRDLALAAALFSIFYQATAEPAFWFTLAMGWMTLDPRGHSQSPHDMVST